MTEQVPIKRKAGRPPGAKNHDTIFKEMMSEKFQKVASKDIQKVYRVLFDKAHEGDMKAIKLILDRVVPQSKAIDLDSLKEQGLSISINVNTMSDERDMSSIIDAEYQEVEE